MDLKKILKKSIPYSLLRKVRFDRIIKRQHHCLKSLTYLVNNFDPKIFEGIYAKKTALNDKPIIWQYWAQGMNYKGTPDLVKICLKSIEEHAENYTLIRISDETVEEYIHIPVWLREKTAKMSKAHFSDLLRCILLSLYGGLWLDASVFLTGEIPQYIFKNNLFLYRRDDSELDKKYWESTFAYYFGWQPDFLVRTLIGIMYAKKDTTGQKVASDFACMLLTYWKNNDQAIDYFFFQIMIEEYFKQNPEMMPETVNDTIPHLLRQYINEKPVPGYSFENIVHQTTLHSLNYKSDVACKNLLALFPKYSECLK